jgi:predicted metal-binding protein
MNTAIQITVVVLLIAASVSYAVWALSPRSLRLLIALTIERLSHGRYTAARLVKGAPGACNSCDTCAAPKATVVDLHSNSPH